MLIDCDIHNCPWSDRDHMLQNLDEPYRTEVARHGLRQLSSGIRYEDGGARDEAQDDDGRRAEVDPAVMTRLHLDVRNVRYGILTMFTGPFAGIPDGDYASAVCRMMNDCNLEYWCGADPRYRQIAVVAHQDPHGAAEEVRRLADRPEVVAVGLAGTAHRIPLGHRYYWPLWEAAQESGLAVHIHPSTTAVIANVATSASGPGSNYLQAHVCVPQFYMADLASLVLEGVFERYPGLKFAMVEGGFSWLPHVLWRMDAEYLALRQEAPLLTKLPSEYVRDHFRFTTQPMDHPARNADLLKMLELVDASRMLMYASDFPHFDADEPDVVPAALPEKDRQAILHDNAFAWFGLHKLTEPADKPLAEMA